MEFPERLPSCRLCPLPHVVGGFPGVQPATGKDLFQSHPELPVLVYAVPRAKLEKLLRPSELRQLEAESPSRPTPGAI